MEHIDLLPLISNLGFPIFVSWYLLTRVESRIETLTASIHAMTQTLQRWQKET